MKTKILILLMCLFALSEMNPAMARRHRPKSCARTVLLPGHSKAMKCSKARKIKNNYF